MTKDQDNPFSTQKTQESCPKCQSELTIKSSKTGTFLGCSAYPKCDYIRPLSSSSEVHVVKILDDVCCPECEGELAVKTGKYGMFIGCMDYPDCSFIVKQDDDEDFEPVPCPECSDGTLHMRTNKKGNVFYACDQYPKCEYLLNEKPVYTTCNHCQSKIMVERGASQVCPRCHKSNDVEYSAEVKALLQGDLIVYPTEAVWGIGCDPNNESALRKLLAAKSRPIEKGVILIASSFEQLSHYINVKSLPSERLEEAMSTWPGAYTWLMPASEYAPFWITGGSGLIAVRVTEHPTVIKMCDEFGGAIVSTSANITTENTPETLDGVKAVFGDQVSIYVDEPLGGNSQPSKIIHSITGKAIRG